MNASCEIKIPRNKIQETKKEPRDKKQISKKLKKGRKLKQGTPFLIFSLLAFSLFGSCFLYLFIFSVIF